MTTRWSWVQNHMTWLLESSITCVADLGYLSGQRKGCMAVRLLKEDTSEEQALTAKRRRLKRATT